MLVILFLEAGPENRVLHSGSDLAGHLLRCADPLGSPSGRGQGAGGHTIAHGGVIEAACGGSGYDTLNGGFADPDDSFGRDGDDVISGFAGDDLVIASCGHDTVHGDEGSDALSFAWLDDDLTIDLSAGTATFRSSGSKQGVMPDGTPFGGAWVGSNAVTFDGIENLVGGHGRLAGTGGDNVIGGRQGDDTVTGNGGTDTAVFDIASTAARVYRLAGDAIDSLHVERADGHDHLIGIDRLQFTDLVVDASAIPEPATNRGLFGTVVHDAQSTGARVYALYDGLLGRAPDALGLEHWADQLDHDGAVDEIGQLLSSPEGQARAGALDNAAFVEQLYGSTPHRGSDPDGLAQWTAALDGGAARIDVADGFVFSPEHLGSLQPLFEAGIYVPDAQAADVARLYYTMLGRAPDATGLRHWTDAADHGGSLQTLAEAFLAAPGSVAHHGSPGNADYVDALYVNALGRHAEDVGLRHWTQLLDTGTSRADLAVELTASQEAHDAHLNQIETGWVLT